MNSLKRPLYVQRLNEYYNAVYNRSALFEQLYARAVLSGITRMFLEVRNLLDD